MIIDRTEKPSAELNRKFSLRAFAGSVLGFGFASSVGAMFLFAWLADEVLEGDTQAFDETIRTFVHGLATDSLTTLMQFFTFIGSTACLTTLSFGVVTVFLFKQWKRAAALFTVTMAGAVILNYTLKLSFKRPRPVPFFDTPLPSSYSFPSGHALFSMCFFGILAWLITTRMHRRSVQFFVWTAAVLFILSIGTSRIYLGVHYPSDVIAGYAASLFWVTAVVFADSILEKRKNLHKT